MSESGVKEVKKRAKSVPTMTFGKIHCAVAAVGGKKEDVIKKVRDAGYEDFDPDNAGYASKLRQFATLAIVRKYEQKTGDRIRVVKNDEGKLLFVNQNNSVVPLKITVDFLPRLADYGVGKGHRIDDAEVDDVINEFDALGIEIPV